jgi:hypothetical protein
MTAQDITFRLGSINERFTQLSTEAAAFLKQREGVYTPISEQIETNLQELNNRSVLKLAFIGQYSSGKSSIISALTGNRHIKIDADIATDQAAEYQWNGITVTDTPGLYTDRADHDAVTYEAIRASDLLVFVITSDLFDDIILGNFIKLAYQDGFRHKMNLVVNKMSMEPGDYEDLKENYSETLGRSLLPYHLSDFDISFIDAADYLDGIRRNRQEYKAMSHFDEFIHQLNDFTEKKGLLGKMDTPFRIVLSELDKALIEVGGNSDNKVFYMLLDRIEDRVRKSIRHAEIQLSWITGELRAKIVGFGSGLSAKVGQPEVDFEGETKQIEASIQRLVEEASNQFEQLLQEEQNRLNTEIKDIFESDLGDAFMYQIQHAADLNVSNVKIGDLSDMQKSFNSMSSIVSKVSGGILDLTMKGAASQAGFFFNSTAVAGTNLHKGIYTVGKFFGHSFKPWGAVNLAAKLGNVMKALGPILSIATVIFDMVQMGKETANFQKVMTAKQECMSDFIELAESIETEFERQFVQYKNDYYFEVLDEISQRRNEAIRQHQVNSDFEKKLLAYRDEFQELLAGIHGESLAPVGG